MSDIHLKGNEWQGFWTRVAGRAGMQTFETAVGKVLNLPDREFLRVLAESGIGVVLNTAEVKNVGTKNGN